MSFRQIVLIKTFFIKLKKSNMKKLIIPFLFSLLSITSFYCTGDYIPYDPNYEAQAPSYEQSVVVENTSEKDWVLIFVLRNGVRITYDKVEKRDTVKLFFDAEVEYVEVERSWGNFRLPETKTRFSYGWFRTRNAYGYVTPDRRFTANDLNLLRSVGFRDTLINNVTQYTYKGKNLVYVRAVHLSDY